MRAFIVYLVTMNPLLSVAVPTQPHLNIGKKRRNFGKRSRSNVKLWSPRKMRTAEPTQTAWALSPLMSLKCGPLRPILKK